ncbi:MAG: ABC transporter ATP-binding protein, partial [Zoogloeaceae bacterium]|nr:ABC transporter ATP-binding protein [Zoogloeaceae bacterium]
DLKNQGIVLEWIDRLARQEGLTVVLTTHHPHHAHAVADQALLMMGTETCACGPVAEILTEDNLQRLYDLPLCRVCFEYQGRTMETLTPVFTGLKGAR